MIAHHIGPIASALNPNIASIVTPVALTITNPGAESSNTGWTRSNGALTTITTGTNGSPRTGSRFFSSSASTALGGGESWSQTITVPSSAYFGVDNFAYNISIDRYMNCSVTGNGASYVGCDFLDANGKAISKLKSKMTTVGTQNVWTLVNDVFTVPPGTRSITIYFFMIRITSGLVYMEDVAASLVQVANTMKVDFSSLGVIFGTRLDAVSVRDSLTYAVLGARVDAIGVNHSKSYFIVTP